MAVNKYLTHFLGMNSAENIVGIFSRSRHNAAKEITESMAMVAAAKKYVGDLNNCRVIIAGDGSVPRTGLLFSYMTKASVLSIDPNFNMDVWYKHLNNQLDLGNPVERIALVKDMLEHISVDCEGKSCVVIWPHSHADMRKDQIFNYKDRTDIALPCCVPIPGKFSQTPHIVYEDRDIISPKRTVHVWVPNFSWVSMPEVINE